MTRYKYLAFSQASAGRDAEYAAWIDSHLEDVLRTPGFVRAQRFAAVLPPLGPLTPNLILYEIEADDPAEAVARLEARGRSGDLAVSDVVDFAHMLIGVYEEAGPIVDAPAETPGAGS